MRKCPGISYRVPFTVILAPDGIGNTSHQMRGASDVSLWQSFQVLSSFGSSEHCRSVLFSGLPSKTYFGTTPTSLTVTVAFGSNTSTIWNGLMWMWNGCEIAGP